MQKSKNYEKLKYKRNKLYDKMFTGLKDVDRLILRKINCERDLARVFQVDKYANQFYNDEKLWIEKFFDRYGKYLEDENVLKYKGNKKWREYFYEIFRVHFSCYPYFISALYMEEEKLEKRRWDILKILERMRGIEHVKRIYADYGNGSEEFFTRDGEYEGIREGMGILEDFHDDKHVICMSLYRNGFTLEENYIENNKIKRYKKYRPYGENKIYKNIEFSVNKQILLKEKISEDGTKQVERFFTNGKPRSKGIMLPKNKKNGKWIFHAKDGTITEKFYNKGKLISTIQ